MISFPYGFYFNGIRKPSGKPVEFSDAIEVKPIRKTDRLFPALGEEEVSTNENPLQYGLVDKATYSIATFQWS